MKKLFTVIGLTAFIASMFLTPVAAAPTSQTVQIVDKNEETLQSYTRFVSVNRTYSNRNNAPDSIRYNSNGYSGTLYLVNLKKVNSKWRATYEGYVTCTGICPMTNTINE
ncbi:MAG TPA: hypothetical protein VIG73_08605 [Cerasibacillus sp.]|uniref:hypothetical protein n=1 Tax=Cerasibacillus sp. TaxID=2498711 RepID=UPI002F41BD0A